MVDACPLRDLDEEFEAGSIERKDRGDGPYRPEVEAAIARGLLTTAPSSSPELAEHKVYALGVGLVMERLVRGGEATNQLTDYTEG